MSTSGMDPCEQFTLQCSRFHVGQRVVTNWGEGEVWRIDTDALHGGVWVRHPAGTPRFHPGNVRPV